MLMKNWVILGSNEFTICFKHKINDERCNYKCNNLFLMCGVIETCGCHSMHLHFIYNHCPSWGLGIDGILILLAH